MRLKLIGLCSICALVFGCVWAGGNISKQKSQKQILNYMDYMPEENSVWTTEEEAEELSKQSQKSVKYDKNKASWRTKEEQEKYEEKKAWKSERNKRKNKVSGKDLKNLFKEPYQRTSEDQRISDERKARRAANNDVLAEGLGVIFGNLSEEEANFLVNVKKIVSHGGKLKDLEDFLKTFDWNINVKDDLGDTALIIAIQNREDELMKCLIENGADVNLPSDNGDTPLNIAVAKNRINIVDYLIEKGAKINLADTVDGDTPLIIAIRGGFEDMIEHLIVNGANVNQKNKLGQTPLIVAVKQEDDWIIDKLLNNNKIDLEIQDQQGYTALMHAVDSNNVEIVEKLVIAGANSEDALSIAQNKITPKENNVQQNYQPQKTKFKGKLAENADRLEQLFKAKTEDQEQIIKSQKASEAAERKTEEEKTKINEIIRLLQGNTQIRRAVSISEQEEQSRVYGRANGNELEQNSVNYNRSKRNRSRRR